MFYFLKFFEYFKSDESSLKSDFCNLNKIVTESPESSISSITDFYYDIYGNNIAYHIR